MQGDADYSAAARRQRVGAELAGAWRGGRRAHYQEAAQGWDLRHGRRRADLARWWPGGLLPDRAAGVVQDISPRRHSALSEKQKKVGAGLLAKAVDQSMFR